MRRPFHPRFAGSNSAVFPLDSYAKHPVTLMQVDSSDTVKTPIWEDYTRIVTKFEPRGSNAVSQLARPEFYTHAASAYAIVATGEQALYANIMLQKGVVL